MCRNLFFGLACLLSSAPLAAQDSIDWDNVGRLDIAQTGFCTATLIGDQLIVTAAHCLYDADGALIAPALFTFHAGLRDGQAAASRKVRRAVAHRSFSPLRATPDLANIAADIAVLELELPIGTADPRPDQVTAQMRVGAPISVISYGRGRSNAASLQDDCAVLAAQQGALVLTCDVDHGASGAPVFVTEGGQRRIGAIVSAMAQVDGRKVALAAPLAAPLRSVMQDFAAPPPARSGAAGQFLTSGQRNETGAKFIAVTR